MKKISMMFAVLVALAFSSQAQPVDLSYLTNRASLASWALKQVNEIEAGFSPSAAGLPNGENTEWKNIDYSGPPSLAGMARALTGTRFEMKTAMPEAAAVMLINLVANMPSGKGKQYLFSGGMSGTPVFDGKVWRFPRESIPEVYLANSIAITVPGLLRAWVVETNAWGWAVKRELQAYDDTFWFDSSLAGQVILCLEVNGKGGSTSWIYDLKGLGQREPMPTVVAIASLRDSQDVRENFELNPEKIGCWVYTYKPNNNPMTYGIVPLMVATFSKETASMVYTGSAMGYANKFVVTRIADDVSPEYSFTLEVPEGMLYYGHTFKPGLYHIVPLGIDVCPDWWKIDLYQQWTTGGGKG